MNAVQLNGITKTFGRHVAVDDLSLEVPEGCVYGFIGPNGSGKTTTLRMIMNIFYPDQGSIRVFGEEVHGAWTDRVGYLPEERGLYKKMKVREVITFYARLKGARPTRADVDGWLERLDLADWATKKVETLSKGMSQKVQFIATVIAGPRMVILDEPFSGLDPVNMDVLRGSIVELQRQGTTVIFSTHDMNTAERMCDYIFMIFRGRKVLDGTLANIQAQYGSDTILVRTDELDTAESGSGAERALGGAERALGPEGRRSGAWLAELPGVLKVRDHGSLQELRTAPEADPQRILGAIMQRAAVRHFEITSPSLHDIFIRIAGPEAEQVAGDAGVDGGYGSEPVAGVTEARHA